MGRFDFGRTVGAALVAFAGMTDAASASRSIRIDDISTGASYNSFTACTLGKPCDTPLNVGFRIVLPSGKTTSTLYVYKEGVVGLGSRVYGTADHLIDYTNPVTGEANYYIAAGLAKRHDLTDVSYFFMYYPDAFGINWYTGRSPKGGVFELLFTYDTVLVGPQVVVNTLAGGDNYPLIGNPDFNGNPTDSTDPAHGPRAGDGLPPGAFVGSNLPGFDINNPNFFDPGNFNDPAPDPGPETLPVSTPEPAALGVLAAAISALGFARRPRGRTRVAA